MNGMNLQITPFGIGIIVVYSAIVILVVGWPLSRWFHKWRWKWLLIVPVVFPLLAAPWAEEAWIAWHFERACRDAGVHVYRKVEVEGYVYDLGRSAPPTDTSTRLLYNDSARLREFDMAGYRFVERILNDGRVWHIERHPDGVYVSILDHPTARYHYKHAYQPTPYKTEERVGWKMFRSEQVVVDSQTNSVIAREVGFNRYPSIAEALWIRLVGSGLVQCPDPGKAPPAGASVEHLPQAALKPSIRQ